MSFTIRHGDGVFVVTFPYSKQRVDAIKTIKNGKYSTINKEWYFPLTEYSKNRLLTLKEYDTIIWLDPYDQVDSIHRKERTEVIIHKNTSQSSHQIKNPFDSQREYRNTAILTNMNVDTRKASHSTNQSSQSKCHYLQDLCSSRK